MLGEAGTDSGPFPPSVSSQFDTVGCILEKNVWQTAMSPTAVCTGLCLFSHKFDLFHSLYRHLWDYHNLKASEVPYIYWDEQEQTIHLYVRLSENPDKIF